VSNSIKSAIARSLALGLVLAGLGACATGPQVETATFESPDGVLVVQSVKLVATVEAVDARNRTLRLKTRHSGVQTFEAHDRVTNFDQIQVGDEVHAEVIEELAITLIRGGATESMGVAGAVALAPLGHKPGIVMVDTVETTGEIIAIDAHDHSVTLEFVDGSIRTLKVGKHRDLTTVALGDSVRAQLTKGVAIEVVKAPEK
jgi:hypothetical protein